MPTVKKSVAVEDVIPSREAISWYLTFVRLFGGVPPTDRFYPSDNFYDSILAYGFQDLPTALASDLQEVGFELAEWRQALRELVDKYQEAADREILTAATRLAQLTYQAWEASLALRKREESGEGHSHSLFARGSAGPERALSDDASSQGRASRRVRKAIAQEERARLQAQEAYARYQELETASRLRVPSHAMFLMKATARDRMEHKRPEFPWWQAWFAEACPASERTVDGMLAYIHSTVNRAQREPNPMGQVVYPSGYKTKGWLYQGYLYDVDQGTYSDEEISLLILDAFDRERRRFERLRTRFAATEENAQQRPRISDAVRIEVWRRDGGKCAHCGSRENLEYDHIVPLSRGGSNTARNIELLCEQCNRSKGGNIA